MTAENIAKLERAIQEFVDAQAAAGEGSSGLVSDYFLAVGFTRIDEDGDQPFARNHVASANPFGALGIAKLCVLDMQQAMKAYEAEDE